MNWGNVYQSIQQIQNMQNMNFVPMNNMPQMNNMNFNPNINPMDQIQMISNHFKNQNQNNPKNNVGGNDNINFTKPSSKLNLCFTTLKGARINMTFDSNVTVDEVLNKFLKRVNLDKHDKKDIMKLNFILSAESLKFGDHRRVKDIISVPANFTSIFVHDTQNLVGARK